MAADRTITEQQLQQAVDALTSAASMLNSARILMSDTVARDLAGQSVATAWHALAMLRSLPHTAGVEVLPPGVEPSPEGFGKVDLTGVKRGPVRTRGVLASDGSQQ